MPAHGRRGQRLLVPLSARRRLRSRLRDQRHGTVCLWLRMGHQPRPAGRGNLRPDAATRMALLDACGTAGKRVGRLRPAHRFQCCSRHLHLSQPDGRLRRWSLPACHRRDEPLCRRPSECYADASRQCRAYGGQRDYPEVQLRARLRRAGVTCALSHQRPDGGHPAR